ncbi:g3541 [Coccomyxa viridis]|uniref:G3541 protein n=1 Tax=Coccomyxa viridis TaxID=1274662 RepID=A0ABP1FTE3_9CHLO
MRNLQKLERYMHEAQEALQERVRERVREQERRTNAAKEDAAAAAAAAVGGLCPEARPQSRNKAAQGGSNRTKARQAAPSPATQPEKQPASRMPAEAPTSHRDEAACPQQSKARAKLPPQTAAKKSKGQTPDDRNDGTSKEQPEPTEPQAELQGAQARKDKAAKRKAAKSKNANLQTKLSASSDVSSTADGSSQFAHQEQAAVAEVPAVATAKPAAQPPKTKQDLQRPSSHGHTAPQTAPEKSHFLQQSTSENLQSAGSSSSAAPDAGPRRPSLPEMPHGWPTDARPAPVRLSKTTLQHSQSSPAPSRPPPLHTLLPRLNPQPHEKQALSGVIPVEQASAQSRAPQQQPHAKAQQDADYAQNEAAGEEEVTQQDCIVCWEEPRQATLAPCGHRALCSSCIQLLLKMPDARCPICRSIVQSFILKECDV